MRDWEGVGDWKTGRERRNMGEEEGSKNLQQPVVTLEGFGVSGRHSITGAGERRKMIEDEGSSMMNSSSSSSSSSTSRRLLAVRERKEWKQGDPRHYQWDAADVYTDYDAMLLEFQTTMRHVSITKENARSLLTANDTIVFSYGFAYYDHWWRLNHELSQCACAAVGGCGKSGLEYRSKAVHTLLPGGPRRELGETIERILRRR